MRRIDAKTSLIVVLIAAFAGAGAIAIDQYQSLKEREKQDSIAWAHIRQRERDVQDYLCEGTESRECFSLIETYRSKGLRAAIEARRLIWQARSESPKR